MAHRENIEGYEGTLAELAVEVGDLRYDALGAFLRALAGKLDSDAAADAGRGRPRLAATLRDAAGGIAVAADAIERAWSFSVPHM